MNRITRRAAAAGALAAALIAGGYATAAATSNDTQDCQERVQRLADNLSHAAALADSTLVAWTVASQRQDQHELEQLALVWDGQRKDLQAAQHTYANARTACR